MLYPFHDDGPHRHRERLEEAEVHRLAKLARGERPSAILIALSGVAESVLAMIRLRRAMRRRQSRKIA